MNYKKIIILDVEMTCWENENEKPKGDFNDIIEIGLIELDGKTLDIVREKQIYVISKSEISEYCSNLTGITHKKLKKNSALEYSVAANILINKYGTKNKMCVGWGLDNEAFLKMQYNHDIKTPLSNNYLNLSQVFSIQHGLVKKINLTNAMDMIGLKFEGRAHSAMEDARNTARLFKYMFKVK